MALIAKGGFIIGGKEHYHPLDLEEVTFILEWLGKTNFTGTDVQKVFNIAFKLQEEFKNLQTADKYLAEKKEHQAKIDDVMAKIVEKHEAEEIIADKKRKLLGKRVMANKKLREEEAQQKKEEDTKKRSEISKKAYQKRKKKLEDQKKELIELKSIKEVKKSTEKIRKTRKSRKNKKLSTKKSI